jgi:hypothetical protein
MLTFTLNRALSNFFFAIPDFIVVFGLPIFWEGFTPLDVADDDDQVTNLSTVCLPDQSLAFVVQPMVLYFFKSFSMSFMYRAFGRPRSLVPSG